MPAPVTAASLRDSIRSLTSSDLPPERLRHDLQALLEDWLAGLAASLGVAQGSGFALVAVGALGRGEFLPHSDLDLVLLHRGHSPDEVRTVAEGLWYPVWDANIDLDHAVRTQDDMLAVAQTDLRAVFGFLRRKLIAGDEDLYHDTVGPVLSSWRRSARGRLPELLASARERWKRFGSVAHRAEPDLKSGKGGARDAQLLDALALAQLTDGVPALTGSSPGGGFARAYADLLDIRTQLRRATGRGRDQLLAQDADEVAATLGAGDRFDLARRLSGIGRTVEYCVEVGLRVAHNAVRGGGPELRQRRPLGEGVVAHGGEVVLAKDARPTPGLVLRVAAAAAVSGLPISQATLGRLAAADLRQGWTEDMRQNLLAVLGAGSRTVRIVEALDRTGLWERMFPEWAVVRDLPPRDPIHVWTVDRHLVETVVQASSLTTRVARPDLLLLCALLHDIGKGREGDHSVIGEHLVREIGERLALDEGDVRRLALVVRQHLLLPTAAMRRDVRDPATARLVMTQIGHDEVVLELLAALSEADSLATGPGVWGDWKARLIAELVASCRALSAGEIGAPLTGAVPLARRVDRARALLAKAQRAEELPGQVLVEWADQAEAGGGAGELLMVAPDSIGLLAKATAVLAIHGLRCHHAELSETAGFAPAAFVASPRFGSPPSAQIIRQDLLRALAGGWDVMAALAERERKEAETRARSVLRIAVPTAPSTAAPKVLWLPGANEQQASVEVRGADRVGLLANLAAVFAAAGVSVLEARVETLGLFVVDVFVLRGAQLSADLQKQLGSDLVAAFGGS
ncbi:UTP-GlnB uridylyltransferase, GlnD [Segniliparus rotundus DSM 44985]|uniref:Bifunctional uridylyltransferase/uridylyl-removing enzyme n=1 Tax=Segniliparus rotundus (strain ATCC BAA-972 / CDC 1076 / CIP 108378 / DSM 44985 / JCM 13578) TaxID=640132 RepID=D6ZA33_SEGRD|nr:[protein-PII] uridylyltransferase [Segniliparus rotundus]ADG98703.1 UTP-GlnB uridylyltransferase, GlnD [Segniliparus rotundus DSM 44985]